MTYGHLRADCLYTGISSGPNAWYRVWEAFTFFTMGEPVHSSATVASRCRQVADRHLLAVPRFRLNTYVRPSGFLSCRPRGLKLPSVLLHCWLGGRKGIRPVKKWADGGGEHWLVRMEWHPAGWSVCLPLLVFPCTIKSRSSLLASAHPGGPGKGP